LPFSLATGSGGSFPFTHRYQNLHSSFSESLRDIFHRSSPNRFEGLLTSPSRSLLVFSGVILWPLLLGKKHESSRSFLESSMVALSPSPGLRNARDMKPPGPPFSRHERYSNPVDFSSVCRGATTQKMCRPQLFLVLPFAPPLE